MRHRLRRAFLFAAVSLCAFGGAAFAGPMEDGQSAYAHGDYGAALALWRPLAEQGVARAQNNLGVIYENGMGVPKNPAEALKWYRLAAEQGYAGAQNNLGLIYALGRGVPQDPMRAHMWLSLAAASLTGEIGKSAADSRDTVAAMLSPPQLEQATEMARRCQAANYKQCESGDPASQMLASATPPGGASRAYDFTATSPSSTPAYATTSHNVTAEDYPAQSIRLHEGGEVTVTYVVGENGSVAKCTVVLSSGSMRLDDAACAMVKKRWKYTPATQGGRPVTIQYVSTIAFPPR